MADAEPPAAGERGAKVRRPLDQPEEPGKGEERERPQAQRLEAQRPDCAGQEGEKEGHHPGRYAEPLTSASIAGKTRSGARRPSPVPRARIRR